MTETRTVEASNNTPAPNLIRAQQFMSWWEGTGEDTRLAAAQAYALIALTETLQAVVRKLDYIHTELVGIKGRMP